MELRKAKRETLLRRELQLTSEFDIKIHQAHQSLAKKPRPEAPPQPIIIPFPDNDFTCEVVKKHKECNRIKTVLKGKGIRFQTPYTSMQIHWDSGTRTYSSAQEAQRDLRKCGFRIEELKEPGLQDLETQLQEEQRWLGESGTNFRNQRDHDE